MKVSILSLRLNLFIATVCWIGTASSNAQETEQVRFKGGYPSSDIAQAIQIDADFQRAVTAYRFWYPAVSVEGIFNGNRQAGIEDNAAMGISAAGPRQVGFTLNSDTPYGSGVIDVSTGPVVIEIPAGGYIGLINDHYQGWVIDLGIPGPNEGKGGKHLIVPPDYQGKLPTGYQIGHSSSFKNLIAVRALPQHGDQKGALESLKKIQIYPLADPSKKMQFVDSTERAMDCSCLKWEDNLLFWEKLHEIIESEPLVEKFLPMYGMLSALGIEKGKKFEPDERMKVILKQAAIVGREQMLVSAFASSRSDRMAWPDRKWEWVGLVPGSAQFETPSGLDLEARDRWFAQAIVTSPAMFKRSAGAGSLYWLGHRDKSGEYLDGGKTYKLTIPQPVPHKLFWSVTAYDAQTRSEVQTDQNKAALRSLFELKDVSTTEPTELYFGPIAPAGKEGQWIKTVPGRGWFSYIRIYGPEKAAFDGTWKPGDFEEMK